MAKAKNGNGKATASKATETPATEEDGVVRFSKGRLASRMAKLAKMCSDAIETCQAKWTDAETPGLAEVVEHLTGVKDALEAGLPLCDALPGPGSSASASPIDVEDVCVWTEKHRDAYAFLGAESFKVMAIHGEGRAARIEIKGKREDGKPFQAIVLRSHVEKMAEA